MFTTIRQLLVISDNWSINVFRSPRENRIWESTISPTDPKHKSHLSAATVIRILIAVVVAAALVWTISKGWSQLSASPIRFAAIRWPMVGGALVCYSLAMLLSAAFWYRVLRAFGQRPGLAKTMLAFFSSQLGKYVPGKAMVVVIRTDMIRGDQVHTAPAAASVFVETITWIFVGSVIACVLLVFRFQGQPSLQVTAALLVVGAGVLTCPPVFRAIAKKILARRSIKSSDACDGLDFATLAFGWAVMSVGWLLNGLSMWLVLQSIPGTDVVWSDYWLALAAVSLATVAGFVSLLPGGLGVRELVMIPLLGTRYSAVTAIMAAVLIRLVWLATELVTSGIILFLYRRGQRNS